MDMAMAMVVVVVETRANTCTHSTRYATCPRLLIAYSCQSVLPCHAEVVVARQRAMSQLCVGEWFCTLAGNTSVCGVCVVDAVYSDVDAAHVFG